MEVLLLVAGAFLAGYWINQFLTIKRILRNPDSMIVLLHKYKQAKEREENSSPELERQIRVERHGNMLYLFAKDNDEFLAQGSTLQEALSNVDKRFPNHSFKGILSKEEADSLGIKV